MSLTRVTRRGSVFVMVAMLGLSALSAQGPDSPAGSPHEGKKIRARVQVRPGGPTVETEMAVVPSPTDPVSISAADSRLPDEDLVLGVVLDGNAQAYPIRYLALYEIVNDRVGRTPVAPSW